MNDRHSADPLTKPAGEDREHETDIRPSTPEHSDPTPSDDAAHRDEGERRDEGNVRELDEGDIPRRSQ